MSDAPDGGRTTGRPASAEAPLKRVKPRKLRRPVNEDVRDDARRSISVRVNTSDYGRLKMAAKQLGVRESDVFRHLLRLGLRRLIRVLDGDVSESERFRLLVSMVGEFSEDFGLTPRECLMLLNMRSSKPLQIDEADLELIGLSITHRRHAQSLLAGILGHPVDDKNLTQSLGDYLASKHHSAR